MEPAEHLSKLGFDWLQKKVERLESLKTENCEREGH